MNRGNIPLEKSNQPLKNLTHLKRITADSNTLIDCRLHATNYESDKKPTNPDFEPNLDSTVIPVLESEADSSFLPTSYLFQSCKRH